MSSTERTGLSIRATGVAKRYEEGRIRALDRVDLSVRAGEAVAIIGPSGCGKSTLLHLLGGLDRPSAGDVVIDGVNISALDDEEATLTRRDKTGFVFQFFNLIPLLTVEENLLLPLELNGRADAKGLARARELLERVGLGGRGASYPERLSGGEPQRVAIARALIHDPALILADEPTGNLDSRTSHEIMELLSSLNEERDLTIVLVTHEHDVASWARRRVVFKDGLIVAQEAA